jgi:hypothetical protein
MPAGGTPGDLGCDRRPCDRLDCLGDFPGFGSYDGLSLRVSGGDDFLPNCGNLVLRLTLVSLVMVAGGPARRIQMNPAMLEGPRADQHDTDHRLFGAGEKLRSDCGRGLRPCRISWLAPPPVRQGFLNSWPLVAHYPSKNRVNRKNLGRMLASEVGIPAQRETTAF